MFTRTVSCALVVLAIGCNGPTAVAPGDVDAAPQVIDCSTCTDPDLPACAPCILGGSDAGSPPADGLEPDGGDDGGGQNTSMVDVIAVHSDALAFAIVGDTRPPIPDDTRQYPTAIITKIWQDIEAERPKLPFAVSTGDYQFSRANGVQAVPQFDLYLKARGNYTGMDFPAMGNHECTGQTTSNCGPGTANGMSGIYKVYLQKILNPLGIHNPYYVVNVTPASQAWSAKLVFIAANDWTTVQAQWLDAALAVPTTYTFVIRHESSKATTAPGVSPSERIIAKHPYTMLIVGHQHTYSHLLPKEIIVGNGGAPLTSGSNYGYGVARRRADGAIEFSIYDYASHKVMDSFVVTADGKPTR